MLKELSTFTQSLDSDLKEIGVEPREGLHIVLSFEESLEGELRISDQFEYALYRKKKADPNEEPLKKCAAWARTAWMVDTNKCIDTKTKAIHSASPYCLAIKRTSLQGGEMYLTRQSEGKALVYGSLTAYFDGALNLLPDETERQRLEVFRYALNSEEKIHAYLTQVNELEKEQQAIEGKYQTKGYNDVKDGEYIIFYLNAPLEAYQIPNALYLQDKLFNTRDYNASVGAEVFGTSAFFNGFPTKKPFLLHQSASFNIAGRISASDALSLHEFTELMGRNIFPRPLPIFIFSDELPKRDLRADMFRLFKEDAIKEPNQRKTYAQVFKELYDSHKDELGNYYLLYYQQGQKAQIKDFDFVSKFEYHLRDDYTNQDWLEIKNILGVALTNKQPKVYPHLTNVFQLLGAVFTPLIGNKYLRADNFFGELKMEDFIISTATPSQHLTMTYLAASTYRKAVYDFVYKSKRDAISRHSFWNMVVSTLQDDLKYGRDYQIKDKLNILFSINHFFDPQNQNFNGLYMPDKLDLLTAKTMHIADSRERVPVVDEYEFAFIAGQMIDYLLSLSNSSDESHAALEGFIQKTDVELFKQEIARLFLKYKHEVERPGNQGRNRVANLMRELMGFDKRVDLKKLHVFVLAGYFSPTFFYRKKQTPETNEQ